MRLRSVILGIIVIILTSFVVSVYLVTDRERRSYVVSESENVLSSLSNSIYTRIRNYMELSRLIMMDERLVKFLRADAEIVDIGMINDARYGVMDILNVTQGVDTVIVFREDLIMMATNRFTYKVDTARLQSDEWNRDIYAKKGRAVVSLNTNQIAVKQDHKPMVTIGRAIYDLLSQKRTGILFMNINPSVFERMLNEIKDDNICIIGSDGTFLAGNRDFMQYYEHMLQYYKPASDSGIIHNIINSEGEKYLLSGCRVQDTPIILLRRTPFGTKGIPYRILYVLLFLLILFLIGAFYVGAFVSGNITHPVFALSASMEKNKRSGELKRIDVSMPDNELGMLKDDYNDLIDHVNELIATNQKKEEILRRAEMRVLQEQIKPHFLYNSIETIGFLALDAGADNVHSALETMGSFYRNFLSKGDKEIPLAREVQIVRDYLSLQKLRYGDIIEDSYDIAPDTDDFIVPKLILQPIVENSIYHGIRLKGEKGEIKITSRMESGILHLTVRDTGVGMSEEMIEHVLSSERPERSDLSEESFGLWGTVERVRIFCGRDDVVRISSEQGEYTEIEFLISKPGPAGSDQ
ncbi:MAG: histidine kinase [Lachnospiraceae bacterium]|nr:histidine kinase [Lachnospiraceae bacterium]